MKLSKLKKLVIDEYLKAYPEIDQEMAAEKFDSKVYYYILMSKTNHLCST